MPGPQARRDAPHRAGELTLTLTLTLVLTLTLTLALALPLTLPLPLPLTLTLAVTPTPNQAPNPEGERQYSSLRGKLLAKGQTAPLAPQSKFAQGPDGTRGFGPPGCDRRGNPLPVVEPPPLEATDGVSGDT